LRRIAELEKVKAASNIWVLTKTDPPGRWCRKAETPAKCEVLVI
jgi:hypothetical protein